jgi:hypothetical protein
MYRLGHTDSAQIRGEFVHISKEYRAIHFCSIEETYSAQIRGDKRCTMRVEQLIQIRGDK